MKFRDIYLILIVIALICSISVVSAYNLTADEIKDIKSDYGNYKYYGVNDKTYVRVEGIVYEMVGNDTIVKENETGDLVCIMDCELENITKGDHVEFYSFSMMDGVSPLDYSKSMPTIFDEYGEKLP